MITANSEGFYKLKIHISLDFEIVDWLFEDIDGKWDYSSGSNSCVYLECEEDAVAFKLRWL